MPKRKQKTTNSQNYTISELKEKLPTDIYEAVMEHISVGEGDVTKSAPLFENLQASEGEESRVSKSTLLPNLRPSETFEQKISDLSKYRTVASKDEFLFYEDDF